MTASDSGTATVRYATEDGVCSFLSYGHYYSSLNLLYVRSTRSSIAKASTEGVSDILNC